uniref:Uncharacterized protein n=1 Tax=Cacopsylla melanoneura TaxID=428564 RepID=A0A8D9F7J5_9HEMI
MNKSLAIILALVAIVSAVQATNSPYSPYTAFLREKSSVFLNENNEPSGNIHHRQTNGQADDVIHHRQTNRQADDVAAINLGCQGGVSCTIDVGLETDLNCKFNMDCKLS